MTSRRTRRLGSEAGFSIIEMLIATVIMVTVTGTMFSFLDPANGMFNAQPEVADMQQRLRVGVDSLQKDLVMAGAGTYTGASAGALYYFFAPIMPYRSGDTTPDAAGTFRTDAVSIVYVPPTPSQTTIRDDMPKTSAELKVNPQPNCPPNKHDQLCGFREGMRVLVFDESGAWDPITITHVQDEALHLQHDGELSVAYKAGASITQVATHTYYLKTAVASKTFQLMHYDGARTDLPVVDNVVELKFEYFGDPNPPQLLPNKSLAAGTVGPWTTYGPKPPALGVPSGTTWPNGENCIFTVVDGQHAPRLGVLGGGGVGQIELTQAMLTDGPWCPDASRAERYDADLLRVRRVRVKMRVQVAQEWLRGPSAVLFKYPGTSQGGSRYVPDQKLTFDITPRNMNLGR